MSKCTACDEEIGQRDGAPWLKYKNIELCSGCYIDLIVPIFEMRGAGDGGMIDLIFRECLNLNYNLKHKKKTIPVSELGNRIARHFGNNDGDS